MPNSCPLVSVLTPVYNGEPFLGECIESVLNQSYTNIEYIILNNCSTDRTLEIALRYAKAYSRVRVHSNDKFVDVITNHNIAFGLVSPSAKYCKVVSADDLIFPECIRQMVELAEANPSVGIVGSYQISGSRVRWQGFNYPEAAASGHEICRHMLLNTGKRTTGHGSPTSLLYRADLVRDSEKFYPNSSPHADVSACYKHLQHCDYGFVYQVLSYERIHDETQSSKSEEINRYASAFLNDLIVYGPFYLTEKELKKRIREDLNCYHRFLATNLLKRRGKDFWDYHKRRLVEIGHPITFLQLLRGLFAKALRESVNPGQAILKINRRLRRQLK